MVTDGLWRQHSFCWSLMGEHIVETNCPSERYFGCILDNCESMRFFISNVPDAAEIMVGKSK